MKSKLLTLTCSLCLMLGTYGRAEDLTFSKTRWSSPTELRETNVALTVTDSALKIAEAPRSTGQPRAAKVAVEIPYSAMASISYGFTDRRRILEGFLITPWLLATKAQSHWLVIEHGPATPYEVVLVRLHKSEFRDIISALNARTGKQVRVLDPSSPLVDPTVGSKDVDEIMEFGRDPVATALQASMKGFGCKVAKGKKDRLECYRDHGSTHRTGKGGETVTATLEDHAQGTRVIIKTRGLGRNWSTPVFREARRRLESQRAAGPAH